jgi:site-specific DNA-methyltransferase (adenine-specific)
VDELKKRIKQGDCIDRVPELAAQFGPFQLIYLDPPFNAGGTRKAREQQGERVNGTAAYVDFWGGLEGFLDMLEPRLDVLKSALSDEGSVWLHLDYRAVHDVKVSLDRVFGRKNFAAEIVWIPGNGGKKRGAPSITHQTILVYKRGPHLIWNADDPSLREPFSETSLRMHFQRKDGAGRPYRERVINGKSYRYYADEGRRLGSVWADCPAMAANTPLRSETTGYPTQKPESLLERILRASTLPDGNVLDPMCGSGTTLAVAARLGRGFAGSDLSDLACRITRERVKKVVLEHAAKLSRAL